MKKAFLLLAAASFITASSQAQIRFAPELGLNISKLRYDDTTGSKYTSEFKFGPKVGAIVQIGLTDHLSFTPGIMYSMKGGERDQDLEVVIPGGKIETDVKSKTTAHYIEMPLNFQYSVGEMGQGGLFFFAGPYVAFLASGNSDVEQKTKTTLNNVTTETSQTFNNNIKIGNTPTDDMKSLDIGGNIGLGYELANGLFFRGQFGMSILNLAPERLGDPSIRNNTIGVSVGYWLGGK